MKFSLYRNFGAKNSAPVFDAFEKGIKKLGHHTVMHDDSADVAVIWSQLWHGRMQPNQIVWNLYRNTGRDVLVIEVGALQRNITWRIMINGEQRFWPKTSDKHRASFLQCTAKPWRHHGNNVIIALQNERSRQWQDMPKMSIWLGDMINRLRQHTDRPILIRPHPRFPVPINAQCLDQDCFLDLPRPVTGTYDHYDLDRSLADAWALINWNSHPAILSVLSGVPAFVGPSSFAAPVAGLDVGMIENPVYADREQWCEDLAWTEWTVSEISNGVPQEQIIINLNNQC